MREELPGLVVEVLLELAAREGEALGPRVAQPRARQQLPRHRRRGGEVAGRNSLHESLLGPELVVPRRLRLEDGLHLGRRPRSGVLRREGERLEDAVGDVAELGGVGAVLAAGVRLGHIWNHSLCQEGRGN